MSEEIKDIAPNEAETKFANVFQMFDGKDGTVWVVFRSEDGTQMAVNYVDIENVVKVKLATEPTPVKENDTNL